MQPQMTLKSHIILRVDGTDSPVHSYHSSETYVTATGDLDFGFAVQQQLQVWELILK